MKSFINRLTSLRGKLLLTDPGKELRLGNVAKAKDPDDAVTLGQVYSEFLVTVPTFAEMEAQATGIYPQIYLIDSDETNGNVPTHYLYHPGFGFFWIVTQAAI